MWYKTYRAIWSTFMVLAATSCSSQMQWELDRKSANGYFARMWRTAACEEIDAPRCPSLARSRAGEILLMFAYQPPGNSSGVLAIVTSTDEGKIWSAPRTVYQAKAGVPEARGSLTQLQSGRLMAPFVDENAVHVLVSDDHGKTWNATGPFSSPLKHAVPSGSLIELDGELLMPLYGELPIDGKGAPCSGLLRSQDGGLTWPRFAEIACDRDGRKIGYGPTAVYATPAGPMLALISVGNSDVYRSVSTDNGKTWLQPEQRMLANRPVLTAVGSTLACAMKDRSNVVRVSFSDNLYESWRCDRMPDQDIKGENFGILALDDERVLVVHDRGDFRPEGRGTPVTKGIEVVMFQRNPACPPVPKAIVPVEQRDTWELAYLLPEFSVETGYGLTCVTPDGRLLAWSGGTIYEIYDGARKVKAIAKAPTGVDRQSFDPGAFSALKNGRWIVAAREDEIEDWTGTTKSLGRNADGYDYYQRTGIKGFIRFRIYYSDDEGETWHGGKRADIRPLAWAHANGRFIEQEDGTLVLPVFGCLSDEDTSSRIDCAGIFRSKDGGESWGDFTLVAYDEKGKEIAYNEIDIEPMPNGTWVAAIRTEWRSHHTGEAASMSVAFSTDEGRTWTKPELTFWGAVPDLAHLPDGGIVCATSFSRLRFSYDGGHTWSRELQAHVASGSHSYPGVERIDDDHLFVFGRWQGRGACVYRRVPAGQ